MTESLSMSDTADLFEIRVRGMLAKMFQIRDVTPTSPQWRMLRGEGEIGIRDLAEMGHELGFDLEVTAFPQIEQEEQPE